MSEGNVVIIAFHALCLIQPYFSAFTTTPNNWKEGLMRQVPTQRTPYRRKETTIKREGRKRGRWGKDPPNNKPEASEKAPRIAPRTNLLW